MSQAVVVIVIPHQPKLKHMKCALQRNADVFLFPRNVPKCVAGSSCDSTSQVTLLCRAQYCTSIKGGRMDGLTLSRLSMRSSPLPDTADPRIGCVGTTS